MLTFTLSHQESKSVNYFNYHNYKQCVNDWIQEQPKAGHGQFRKLSEFLRIHSVVLSQVFRGDRDLTVEQALGVCQYIGMTDLETEYFLLLVQKARAGSRELQEIFERQLVRIREQSLSLKNRIKFEKMTDEHKARFYSQWYYSAIRLGSSIPHLQQPQILADYLGIERNIASKIIDFLIQYQLLIKEEGQLKLGPQVTHVGHDSIFVNRHHTNWRLQALQNMERTAGAKHSEQLFYTGPMALSKDAAIKIRQLLIELIQEGTKLATDSDSEVLRCLNIDWFIVGNEVDSKSLSSHRG